MSITVLSLSTRTQLALLLVFPLVCDTYQMLDVSYVLTPSLWPARVQSSTL